MKIKENKILNTIKEYKSLIIIALVIIIQVIWLISSHNSYAYYSSSNELPILSTKIGEFAKGDTTPLDTNTDINLLYYIQDIFNPKEYVVLETAPVDIKEYTLVKSKSNCIPEESELDNDKVKYSNYGFDEKGNLKITVSEDKPHQIVCRLYYNIDFSKYDQLNGDINVIALVESNEGTIVKEKGDKKYTIQEIPESGYRLDSYECNNKVTATQTEITYENNKMTVKYKVPDLCYAYFNKVEG